MDNWQEAGGKPVRCARVESGVQAADQRRWPSYGVEEKLSTIVSACG